jgi:phosphocarrier protein FPr
MVAIVIVSHSERLAEGVKELALQMTRGKVPIEVAGGIDDPGNPIGTDPMKVLAAIEAAHAAADSGVLVLMDLGSALMSAETALDFLPAETRASVRLCAAPVVEGAITAAIQASTGASLDAVAAETLTALAAKKEQLAPLTDDSLPTSAASATEKADADAVETRFVIRNRIGLHARPAANFVITAAKFQSAISVFKGSKTASARSINQMAALAACRGDEIRVRAVGPDAEDAIAAIEALNADNFGDKDEEILKIPAQVVPAPAVVKNGIVDGVPASPGVAIGPAHLYRPALPEIDTCNVADPEAEITRLVDALIAAYREIETLTAKTKRTAGAGEATIFDFHRLLLNDPDLVDQAKKEIRQERINAAAAWLKVMETAAETYRSLDNAYMQGRAADVIDAGNRVLRQLTGESRTPLFLDAPAVIVAHDLLPSDVARLDPAKVLGLITVTGGSASHAAILARSLGIPAVVGAGPAVSAIDHGTIIALDGDAGRIWLSPEEKIRKKIVNRRAQWLEKRRRFRQEGHKPAVTADGAAIHVTANISGPREARRAFDHGAEGVGLFRTEFLFQERDTAPSEDEQYTAYVAAARAMKGRPVTIRILDAGGDKPLSYVPGSGGDNPFLGQRGIRLCLAHADVFRTQLRAILRASFEENIRIMFPMVTHLAELRKARTILEESRRELAEEGVALDKPVKIGIMIEVPAAVAMADQLAKEADFFSIGTNDLTQYAMAADRGNAAVASLSDSFHPAVLRMVHKTVKAGHGAGIPVGMCGELAARTDAAALLVGLGLDELSMNANTVPGVKAAIRKLNARVCRDLAAKALDQIDGDGVRKLLTNFGSGSV